MTHWLRPRGVRAFAQRNDGVSQKVDHTRQSICLVSKAMKAHRGLVRYEQHAI